MKNFNIITISTTTHIKMNYRAVERHTIGLSFWLGEPLSLHALFFRIVVSFSVTAVSRPFRTSWACSNNNSMLFCFVAQGLVVEGFGDAFLCFKDFEKTGFFQKGNLGKVYLFLQEKPISLSFGDKFTNDFSLMTFVP